MELKIGDDVEFVKYDERKKQRYFEKSNGLKIGMKLKIVDLKHGMYLVDYEDRYVYKYQIKHIPKKKPYWIEVEEDYQSGYSYVMLKGKNRFDLSSDRYDEKSRANQQAKRLAKNLGLEFRQ